METKVTPIDGTLTNLRTELDRIKVYAEGIYCECTSADDVRAKLSKTIINHTADAKKLLELFIAQSELHRLFNAPISVMRATMSVTEDGTMPRELDVYECPTCGRAWTPEYYEAAHIKYCCECGQALLIGDIEEPADYTTLMRGRHNA